MAKFLPGEWDWQRDRGAAVSTQNQQQSNLMSALANFGQRYNDDINARHREAVFNANPDYAAKIYGAPLNEYQRQSIGAALREEQRQIEQRGALAKIAENISGGVPMNGQMGPVRVSPGESALAKITAVTGDPSSLAQLIVSREKASAPDSGGATGVLVDRLMKENPGLSFGDALAQIQTGYRRGVNFEGGVATPIEGFGASLGAVGGQENYGKEAGTLRAQGELKPQVEADIVTAQSDARYMAEGKQKLPYAQRSLQSAIDRNSFLDKKLASIESRANGLTTGWTGSLVSAIPGTEAYDLKADVDTLLANAGFDRLQEMRDNSPTGGALGAVSERELALLQASAQNLLNSQSKEQFIKNLASFKEQRTRTIENMHKAYEQDYARFGGSKDTNLPSPAATQPPSAPTAARKRYNPATGKLE